MNSNLTAEVPQSPSESTLKIRFASILERLDLDTVFPQRQPVEVELGSGDGNFIVEYAKAHPERNFIGVERLLGRLRKIDKKGKRAGLMNLRVIRLEASYVVEYLLPPTSVAAFHIYFPDPWPKRKHRRKRLINSRFAGVLAQALVPGGTIYLRTDDADYFAQMKASFQAQPYFRETATPEDLARLRTDFEREFHQKGVPTLSVSYERQSAANRACSSFQPFG